MTNNDLLRRLCQSFSYGPDQVQRIAQLTDRQVDEAAISSWLLTNNESGYQLCPDIELANFLNGLIIERRGAKEGPKPVPEQELNNNSIFMKIKIALNYQAQETLEVLASQDIELTKRELSAFFRNAEHKHFKPCPDAVLWGFVKGFHERSTQA